jgi:hypothetical protein
VSINDHARLSLQDLEIEKQKTIKASSLSLDRSSRIRVVDPAPSGFTHTVLKLLGYYGKQSRLIRGANTLYSRISHQVDQPELYASELFFYAPNLICRGFLYLMLLPRRWCLGHRFCRVL